MRPVTYQVSLTKGHGYPACPLYSGGSEEMMHEIAGTLRRVADLH